MSDLQLCLGCATLGNEYGPAGGVTDYGQAKEIIDTAYELGVRWFDTAAAYGKSEEWLAQALDGRDARVVTKVRQGEAAISPEPWALLLHEGYSGIVYISGPEVANLGVSCRDVDDAERAMADKHVFSVLQVPASVFDRRMARAGIFERAHEAGMTVFVRSVFCGGKVFEPTRGYDEKGHLIPDEQVRRLWEWVGDSLWFDVDEWEIAEHCFWYVRHMAPHAIPVIGADTPEHVEENVRIAKLFSGWDDVFPTDDPDLYPENWR